MATLGQAKMLGGVGSILLLIGLIPYTEGILGIVGLILILFAVKYISDVTRDPQIFRNMMISVVFSIIGIIAAVVTFVGAFVSFFHFGSVPFNSNTTIPSGFFALLALIIIGVVILWVFLFVGSFFLKRSYDSIATRLNVGMFHTTGLLYVIGAGLLILGVGIIILFVAEILQIVAFFSLPEQVPMAAQPAPGQWAQPPPSGTM